MKLKLKNGVGYSSNTDSDSKSVRFSIGKNEGFLIDAFRNRLYADKIKTPVQEYLSNARDANIEAGNGDTSIQVTLPTEIEPTLKIRDYGPGVGPDKIELFSTYGESTKRESNDFIGGFGVGSKSFWAYSDSFQVTTYIDGIKRGYIAHIGKSNEGDLDELFSEPTDEPNGTEIGLSVKVHDISAFKKAVFFTTFFWDVKPRFLGILDEEIEESYKNVEILFDYGQGLILKNEEDFLRYHANRGRGKRLILNIGGIPYFFEPTEEMVKELYLFKRILILNFENGELQVAITRESVDLIEDNINKILDKIKKVSKEVLDRTREEIKACETIQDHAKFRRDFKAYYNHESSEYELIDGARLRKDLLDGLFSKKYKIKDEDFIINGHSAENDHYLGFFKFVEYSTNRRGTLRSEIIKDVHTKDDKETIIPKRLDLSGNTGYVFLDVEDKPRTLSRKIKKLLRDGIIKENAVHIRYRRVIVIEPKTGLEFKYKDEIHWLNSSEIILPKPVRKPKDQQITTFNVANRSSGSGITLDSEKYEEDELEDYLEEGKRFIYFPVKYRDADMTGLGLGEIKGLTKFFSKRDIKLIGLSATMLKKWPKSVPIEKLDLERLKTQVLRPEEKEAKVFDRSMLDFLDDFISRSFGGEERNQVKDRRIRFALACKTAMGYSAKESDLGPALVLFEKEMQGILKRREKYNEFFKKLREQYYSLRNLDYYYSRDVPFRDEEARNKSKKSLIDLIIVVMNLCYEKGAIK